VFIVSAAVALGLSSCSPVTTHKNTRYFVTEKEAGTQIHLRRGDEVTFNLVVRNDRDWTAISADSNVARPAGRAIMVFANGERSRFIDFDLVRSGHVTLTACPSDEGMCSLTAAGAVTVEVDVT
jgi:hypothetical protein